MSVDAHSIWLIDLSASSQEHFAQSFAPIVERALALDWFLPEHRPAMTISLLDHGNVMGDAYARHAADTTAVPQLYAGADFAILKPQILDLARPGEIPQKKDALTTSESADSAVSVLLTFGGSDPSGCTLSAAKMLVPLSRHIDVVTIVLGALNETERSSVNELLGNIPHQIVCNPDDFEQRLAYADVVLCGGGGTLLEAMYLGRPCIVFAQSPEEKAHAALYVSVSACVWPDRLADVLACAKLRSSLSYSAAQQVDGRGVDRIRSKLMELS
jgi:spore coat polysaccharide biosynthesis predicted glycosyltransferase SpsG